jgi:pimeloyl-ACP methyl ester carboxylesterase
MWRDFPALLGERIGRTVIAYDRLGFGLSSAREELPSVEFVSEEAGIYLPAILNALQIERCTLFGHSVGGAMAVASAGRMGGRCNSVVTESAQAFVEDRTLEGIRKAKEDFKDPKVFERLAKYHGSKTSWVLDAWIKIWLSKEFANWSLREDLPRVKCPLMAIHGDRDEYGTQRFPETICELAEGETRLEIISDCGHVPHREKPEVVLDLLANFLQ